MKKTVLITRVAGLLGSRLADWIIENHPDRPRQVWDKYELEKGICPFWNKETLASQAHSTKLL